jgi:hypothetical protein
MNSETLKKLYAMAYKKAKQDVEHSTYDNVLKCISNIANDYTTFKSLYDKVNDMKYIIDTSIKTLPEQVYQVLTWSNIIDKPAQFPPAPHSHKWSSITGKPTAYNPTQHSIIDYHTVPADSDKEVPITSNGMVQLRRLRIDDIKELDNRLTSIQENVGKGYVSIRSGSGGTPLTIKEEDDIPSVNNVKTIVVSNDTLTDNGSGQVTIDTGGGIDRGTSFPGSPATDDIFYRTDLSRLAQYDGTRWLSTAYPLSLPPYQVLPVNITSSTYALVYTLPNDVYFIRYVLSVLTLSAPDASNYWTITLGIDTGTLDTQVINSGTSWRQTFVDIGELLETTSTATIFLQLTKTGSPPPLTVAAVVILQDVLP